MASVFLSTRMMTCGWLLALLFTPWRLGSTFSATRYNYNSCTAITFNFYSLWTRVASTSVTG